MPVIKKSTSGSNNVSVSRSSSNVIRSKISSTLSVTSSTTSPSTVTSKSTSIVNITENVEFTELRRLRDVNFGDLDSSKDGFIVSYNETSDKLELISADDLLVEAVEDNDLPDAFVEQVVEEASSLTASIDGGSFV